MLAVTALPDSLWFLVKLVELALKISELSRKVVIILPCVMFRSIFFILNNKYNVLNKVYVSHYPSIS